MKGKFHGSYRSKAGNTVFRYLVTGSDDELLQYQEAQGTNYRESDDKEPLFFTTRFTGDNIDLIITNDGKKVIADTSKFDKAASMAAQYGGNLGQELAKAAALELLAGTRSAAVPAPAPVKEPAGNKVD